MLVALLALCFLSILFGIAFAVIQTFARLQGLTKIRAEALVFAINTMEMLKTVEYPVSSFRKEGNLVVRWGVQEFTPTTFLLEVSVENEQGRRFLSLRTLRRKRFLAP
ncbi:MAG: hypothetical protein NZ706_02055 [Candidatus Caldatribacterium sp.]|nr:hypothetical protein [Candidatus Caldatribacterium sp.]MDW8080796.1 hypothetical protein [Candidatus Calescibacterium sp.]